MLPKNKIQGDAMSKGKSSGDSMVKSKPASAPSGPPSSSK